MSIGKTIRQLREQKGLSQGDIEKACGLIRCHISRVERGHTVPSLETLERFAAALDVPLYTLFYPAEDAPLMPNLTAHPAGDEAATHLSNRGPDAELLGEIRVLARRMAESDRNFLLDFARKLAVR